MSADSGGSSSTGRQWQQTIPLLNELHRVVHSLQCLWYVGLFRFPSVARWIRLVQLSPSLMLPVRRRCAQHLRSQPAEVAASQQHWDSRLQVSPCFACTCVTCQVFLAPT